MKDHDKIIEQDEDLHKSAWKKALEVFPAIRQFGRSIHNRGNLTERAIAHWVLRDEPVRFVGFWGTGDKIHPDLSDHYLFNTLVGLHESVAKRYNRGAGFFLILADEHGAFNGFDSNNGYLHAISEIAQLQCIESVWLSDLYRNYGLVLPAIDAEVDVHSEAFLVFSRQREQLVKSAQRHNGRGVDPEKAAYHYVEMRLQEREMLTQAFPHHILFVNGSKDLVQRLLPQSMPILYLKVGPVWFQNGQ